MKILRLFFYALILLLVGVLCWYLFNIYKIEAKDTVADAPEGTRFETVGDEQIAYSEIDNHAQTTVLFIGGLSAWHGTWERVMAMLNIDDSYNYTALDLPPFGYSKISANADFSRDAQAKRISAFIKQKQAGDSFKRVILVAHSYGAGPSAEVVMLDTEHTIQKFVVIDGVLNIDEEKETPGGLVQIDLLRNLGVGIAIHIEPLVINRLKSFVYKVDHIDTPLAQLYTKSFNTKGTTTKLSKWVKDYVNDPLVYSSTESSKYQELTIPVRIIWGENDTLTPLSLGVSLQKLVPGSKLYVLKNVGHIPMIEDYEQFDAALKKAIVE